MKLKLVGIGDLFIPAKYIEKGFKDFENKGVVIETVDWVLKDFDELQEINLLVEKLGSEAFEPPEYILNKAQDADILITQFCTVTKKFIDNCPNLKIIGVLRGGYENINVKYATENNIIIFNNPGRNADAVADFTIGMIISECRNISRGHMGLKNGQWIRRYPNSDYIPDIPGKTVGIIGLGEIGKKVAKRLKGFDVNILGYDPFVNNVEGVQFVELEELMQKSDFITVHVKLTTKTEKLIDKRLLQMMKPTAYIINTSRAGIIDEKALYEVLKNRNIAGAALDVFDVEPPGRNYPIVTLENVTITPHMAGGTTDSFLNSPKKLALEIEKLWEKSEPRCIVNKHLFLNLKNTKQGIFSMIG